MTALLLIIFASVSFFIIRRKQQEIDSKILFAEHLNDMLNNTQSENSKFMETINTLLATKHQLIEDLCNVMIESNDSKTARRRIADKVSLLIESLSINSQKIRELESEANSFYNNLYTDFCNDLPNLKEADYRLFLFSIHRFSNTAISLFLKEEKINAVYDRKRRLKDKIKKLATDKKIATWHIYN